MISDRWNFNELLIRRCVKVLQWGPLIWSLIILTECSYLSLIRWVTCTHMYWTLTVQGPFASIFTCEAHYCSIRLDGGRLLSVVTTLPSVPHPPQWVLTKASEIIFPLVSFMNNLKLWDNSIRFQIMDTKQFPKKERKKKKKLHDIQTIHTTDYCLPKIPDAPLVADTV